MPELILSDITVMGQGYCVIGLEKAAAEAYRSVRPLPPRAFAWREPFPFQRGDRVHFSAVATITAKPHVEDQQSRGLVHTRCRTSETELVGCLRKAEVADNLGELFGCPLQASDRGGRALWVNPTKANRSVCGCEYDNLRFRVFSDREGPSLRAEISVRSGERISSIPVVDREWRRFVERLLGRIQRENAVPLLERFLNRSVALKLLSVPARFVRIGLPRPKSDQQCWLMLDSLFPQPEESWLDLL